MARTVSTEHGANRRDIELLAAASLVLLDRQYSKDPWLWLTEEVMTVDETTKRVAPWPIDKVYTKELLEVYQTHRLVAVPKSRRMMVSWLTAAWVLWNIRYKHNCAVFWQSDTEAHAAYVIDKRIKFMEDHLLTEALRKPYEEHRTKDGLVGRMDFYDNRSYVWAIPQGDSVIRSYTFSIMVMDECEFQPEAHRAFTAAIPIAEKGAQLILISSSNGPSGVLASICKEVGFTRFA